MFAGPEGPDRYACEDAAEDGPNSVADDNGHDCIVGNFKSLDREDTPVLKKHRTLCQPQGQIVDYQGRPESLQNQCAIQKIHDKDCKSTFRDFCIVSG